MARADLIPARVPLVDQAGRINSAWYQFLHGLWLRSGASTDTTADHTATLTDHATQLSDHTNQLDAHDDAIAANETAIEGNDTDIADLSALQAVLFAHAPSRAQSVPDLGALALPDNRAAISGLERRLAWLEAYVLGVQSRDAEIAALNQRIGYLESITQGL